MSEASAVIVTQHTTLFDTPFFTALELYTVINPSSVQTHSLSVHNCPQCLHSIVHIIDFGL